jgi:molecular chaperone GrpE (heat shock protein)
MPYKLTLLEEEIRQLKEENQNLRDTLNKLNSDFEASKINEECKIANFVNEMSYKYVTDYINT